MRHFHIKGPPARPQMLRLENENVFKLCPRRPNSGDGKRCAKIGKSAFLLLEWNWKFCRLERGVSFFSSLWRIHSWFELHKSAVRVKECTSVRRRCPLKHTRLPDRCLSGGIFHCTPIGQFKEMLTVSYASWISRHWWYYWILMDQFCVVLYRTDELYNICVGFWMLVSIEREPKPALTII